MSDLSPGDRVQVYIPEGPGHRYDGALGTVVCRTPSQIGDYSVQLDGSRLQNWFYASELIKESK